MKHSMRHKWTALLLSLVMVLTMAVPAFAAPEETKPLIGISWESNTQDYNDIKTIIETAGGIPVELAQVTSTAVGYDAAGALLPDYVEASGMLKQEYADQIKAKNFAATNVASVMEGIDGVFMTGGEDISPSLYGTPAKEANHGEEINAARDISDYTLEAYCIEKDIPMLAVCRGEQMMGIVSGASLIQDIPDYFSAQDRAYFDTHRMPADAPDQTYARHDVELTRTDSQLYRIVGSGSLANVSSWHHQAIASLEGTGLIETAKTVTNGVEIIEGIENPSKTFCVAVQFHPENDCGLALAEQKPEEALCNLDVCLNFFQTLVKYAAA